jgi:hypothetical protein
MPKLRYVTHVNFIEKFNLFAASVYDKSQKTSTLEIYYFTRTGFIQDKFRLRSNREAMLSEKTDSDLSPGGSR